MDSVIALLKDTPIPTILVLSGIVFLFLALAGQIAGKLEVPPTRQKWAAAAGAVFLSVGLLLYLAPGLPRASLAEGMPEPTRTALPEIAAVDPTGEPQEPTPAQGAVPSPPSSIAANSSATEGGEDCMTTIFSDITSERVVRVESGSSKELLGIQQTKEEPAGIILLELGKPIIVLTYNFVEDGEVFKIGAVVDGACQPMEFDNTSRGGPKEVLQNWDTLEVKSGATNYTLRFGYYGGMVSLVTSYYAE
jgi:hypothetical protein